MRSVAPDQDVPNGCLDAFLREIHGQSTPDDLKTADVLLASRQALLIQQRAAERV